MQVSFAGLIRDKSVLELDRGDGCTHCEGTDYLRIVYFKVVDFVLSESHLNKKMF